MIIKEITSRSVWNTFVKTFDKTQLLNSWEWLNFQESIGRKTWRLGCFNYETLIGVFVLIKISLPLKFSYLYTPRSPLVKNKTEFLDKKLKEYVKNIAREENSIYWKIDILEEDTLNKSGLTKVEDLQPSRTLMLDLTKTDDELLASFHHKTRYNIRLATKKGVSIDKDNTQNYSKFLKILEETTKRDQFSAHNNEYYKKLVEEDSNFAKLYFAKYKKIIIAGNLIVCFGDTVTYLHGASSNFNRNVMAPFALQWECIREAKRLGYKYYDFWGINEKKWPGVTRFKKGFVNEDNGYDISYPGTYDLIINPLVYWSYRLLKAIKNITT